MSYGPLAYGLLTGAIDPQRRVARRLAGEETEGVFAPEAAARIAAALDGIARASSGSASPPRNSPSHGTCSNPGSRPRSPAVATPTTSGRTRGRETSVPDDDTLQEIDALLGADRA